ncbi:6-hydroxy-D-nicotine oxidase [Coccidioides immitis RS]|uniref:6-hydroxy-D-nicotine oxidase n=4 Tax=Coccidioides immitis TaxID=5501 RepID=J3KJ48_COCIM|nr:6-hydroxy-D-nicotine oxidase [Coccidioides immitis RS]EAS36048.3 6-hydroxy-D-nicotine oxidase [Coccidioides immitis RS]KMP01356.1 6-hydroxy-D-nicotine oxidase [Coccidioides immitis RMSCC 2394]KMU83861.1 6-hydroxy-D-nicotine oxidase [Coccidioides immitis H538.4]TPX25779.1 hypothetical protein DIZ76_011236 [Coccidioides immitis]
MASSETQATVEIAEALRSKLEGSEVLTPSSPGYEDAIKRWSDAAVKRAGMVMLATSAEDISKAVRFAQENNIDLAIRGGGHSVSGTSSSDGGLVIDLSLMRKVTVDPAKKTITAQGGALWVDVDTAAAAHNLAMPGGTVNHTGIGGLTLGGGYGWLSAKYGLVIDNLISAKMVLADGRIVTTSATEEPDLFWAIRGAGHNFGVAAEFTYQGYEQVNQVYAGPLIFTVDKLEGVIEALNSTLQNPDENSGAVCAITRPPNAPDISLIVIVFHNGTEEEGKKRFERLFALKPEVIEAKMIPYSEVNTLMNVAAQHGGRRTFKGLFFAPPLSPAFARKIASMVSQKLREETDMGGSVLVLEFFDMRKIIQTKLTDTAFANRGTTLNGVLSLRWENPANDMRYRQWSRDLQMLFKEELDETRKNGITSGEGVPQYINYAEPGDIVVPSIYGVNGERLQKLKARYDPDSVFGKMNPIIPAK